MDVGKLLMYIWRKRRVQNMGNNTSFKFPAKHELNWVQMFKYEQVKSWLSPCRSIYNEVQVHSHYHHGHFKKIHKSRRYQAWYCETLPEGHFYSIIKWDNTTIQKDITIILSMEIIILPMDQHHPINGSLMEHHHHINGEYSLLPMDLNKPSSILLMDHQWEIIILSMEHHHSINEE